jgi:hypothetical protein
VSGVTNAVCSSQIVQNYKVYINILIWHIRFHFFMADAAQLVLWGFITCRIRFFRRLGENASCIFMVTSSAPEASEPVSYAT